MCVVVVMEGMCVVVDREGLCVVVVMEGLYCSGHGRYVC